MKYIFYILLFYLLYRLLRIAWRVFTRPDPHSSARGPDNKIIDEMVQDPLCKTYIPRREAVKRTRGGQDYFFCSKECADKFESQGRASDQKVKND